VELAKIVGSTEVKGLMYWVPRTIAVATVLAVVFYSSVPALAAPGATITGTVEIPCDPSRVSEVVSVQIRPVPDGPVVTAAVDAPSGRFLKSGLTEGEYDFMVIGADGDPLSPEPKRLQLREGWNEVILSMQPPGCGEQDLDRDGVPDSVDSCPTSPPGTVVGKDGCLVQGEQGGLKDWQLTLIYVGVVGAAILVLDLGDEEPASPF
jgi:hypothetical protein